MRSWNGWGDEAVHYPVPAGGADFLAQRVGPAHAGPDASLDACLASVPASPLAEHPLVSTDARERLWHARGQSLPDLIAMRSGQIDAFPDGVARPTSEAEVRALYDHARKIGARLIPWGGGTSVVGHVNPRRQDAPVITVDLGLLDRLVDLDEQSRLATFEAGVAGPSLEAQLAVKGYTLGHFPQSFEYSTLGGWIATRSSGQQSYHYGRIEDLFAGGRVETPVGTLDMPNLPATAAGPDLRQLILGSEGRLGIVTRASVRVRPIAQDESFHGIFFPDWQSGTDAVRTIAQAGIGVSMLRLSDPDETETQLALAGMPRVMPWVNRGLRLVGYGDTRCILMLGLTGDAAATADARSRAFEICRKQGGFVSGTLLGKKWEHNRFRAPYLRNTLWQAGYAIDTLETAVPWSGVYATATAVKTALRTGLQPVGERVHAFAHLSHLYPDGASIYTTYVFRRGGSAEETMERWRVLKGAASEAIVAHKGTISHQHGVGADHLPYLEAEKGVLGMQVLEAARKSLDPDGLLNPGKLLPA